MTSRKARASRGRKLRRSRERAEQDRAGGIRYSPLAQEGLAEAQWSSRTGNADRPRPGNGTGSGRPQYSG